MMRCVIELTKKQIAKIMGQAGSDKVIDVSIEDMKFYLSSKAQGRTISALKDLGINNAKQLCKFTKVELLSANRIGPRTVRAIELALEKINMEIK